MDCVYICRSGDNEELRYSIRSVVKNLRYRELWLVGDKPDWYDGNFIPVKDIGNKFKNISNCLKVISQTPEISNNFTLMNDDFYILKKMKQVPIYHGGFLTDKVVSYAEYNGNNIYTRIISDTVNKLKRMDFHNPLDYDIHTPMIMNKNKLNNILGITLAPRSMYGNVYEIGGDKINDVKVYLNYDNVSNKTEFLSSEDNSFYLMKEKLEKLFPDPSLYERNN